MMTDGDVSARDSADEVTALVNGNLAGHVAIGELLSAQAMMPPRSRVARIFGFSPLTPETHQLYRGVVGEIEVGESLDRLGPDWIVLHALPVDSEFGDIDHLVVGPAGVFIVATKNHAGATVWSSERTFIVAGIRVPYVRSMEYEIGRVEKVISDAAGRSVEVSGILAIVAAKSLVVRGRHRDVAVLPSDHLVGWLSRRRRVLSHEDVLQIGTVAALETTWHQGALENAEPGFQRERFEALRAEVRSAWLIQLTWAIGVSVVVVGTFAVVTWSILMNAIESFGV
jgi:hypothetical protein